jgi:hypothetical protein
VALVLPFMPIPNSSTTCPVMEKLKNTDTTKQSNNFFIANGFKLIPKQGNKPAANFQINYLKTRCLLDFIAIK